MLTEEGFKIRVAALRKEEEALSRERERLERDKVRCDLFCRFIRNLWERGDRLRRCAFCVK